MSTTPPPPPPKKNTVYWGFMYCTEILKAKQSSSMKLVQLKEPEELCEFSVLTFPVNF